MLAAVEPRHRLALDHVDDLVAVVFLGGPAARTRSDRHDRALRAAGLVEHAEELAAMSEDGGDVRAVLRPHWINTPFWYNTTPSHRS
jgi:hypothetical protein